MFSVDYISEYEVVISKGEVEYEFKIDLVFRDSELRAKLCFITYQKGEVNRSRFSITSDLRVISPLWASIKRLFAEMYSPNVNDYLKLVDIEVKKLFGVDI